MADQKKKLVGSIQESLKKPESEGLRKEIRFLEPEGNGDNLHYPGYLSHQQGTQEVSSEPVRIYPKSFEKNGQKHVRFVVRKLLTAPEAAKNSGGAFVDSEGNVVENEQDAAVVQRAVKYNGTDRKVFLTMGEFFSANESHKGTPYGQTMVVGSSFDEETAKEVARKLYKAGNLKAANRSEDAKAVYDEVNALKKEKGSYSSMFISKSLAADLATRFGASIELSQEAKHNKTPTDDFDDDIPFG